MDLGIFTLSAGWICLNQTYGLQNQGADVHFWSSQYSEVLRSGNFVCRSNWEARPNCATLRSVDLPLAYSFGQTVSNSFKQFQTFEDVSALESKCCRFFGKMHCALCWYLKWSQPLGVVHRYIWVHPEFLAQRSVVQCLYFPSGEVRRLFGLDLCHCSSAGRGEVFCCALKFFAKSFALPWSALLFSLCLWRLLMVMQRCWAWKNWCASVWLGMRPKMLEHLELRQWQEHTSALEQEHRRCVDRHMTTIDIPRQHDYFDSLTAKHCFSGS